MTEERPYRFLVALGQALSTARLYEPDHPARERALDQVWERARELLDAMPHVVFTFLEGEVALGDRRIRDLRDWPWVGEFTRVGVERVEIESGLAREELSEFLGALRRRLEGGESAVDDWDDERRHIRFGGLGGHEEGGSHPELEASLGEVDRILEQARTDLEISSDVAEAVVQSVVRAIRRSRNVLKLLVPLKEVDQYSTVHSMNVSVLSIGFAEHQGFRGPDVKRVGESALLHDVGKSLVPEEILHKPDSLNDEEWELIQQHPEDGARILLRSRDDGLVLPAVVAYEHHMYVDGSGYPPRRYARDPHPISQLVQICDIFDALRTRRPFRGPWPIDEIFLHLKEGAGTRFHARTVRSFTDMLRAWGGEVPGDNGNGTADRDRTAPSDRGGRPAGEGTAPDG